MNRLLLGAAGALLLFPAAAHAGGTVAVEGPRLVVTGTPGADTADVFRLPDTGEYVVAQVGLDAATGPQVAGPGCTRESRNGDITKIYCAGAGITEVTANAGDGDDRLVFESDLPARADAGAGDDQVDNYGGAATVLLGDGDDLLLTGRKSATTAFGGDGADDLSCSDDRFNKYRDKRVYDGGAGKDRLCGAHGDDRLDGGTGNDKIRGSEGDDRIDGESGDDLLAGEDEDDTIIGGRGEDEIEGGAGKDTIRARDRERDDVDGGSKRDTVQADRKDDLTRCEVVRRR